MMTLANGQKFLCDAEIVTENECSKINRFHVEKDIVQNRPNTKVVTDTECSQ